MSSLKGKKVLITAGPTREAVDAVRFLSNPSTGKMGFALASAAKRRGSEVTLVSGPTFLNPPRGVKLIQVKTAREMYRVVLDEFKDTDVFISAAAVADYRPVKTCSGKIKKTGKESLLLKLKLNPDILKATGENKGKKILVGFAAETNNLIKNALRKLKDKNLDFIIANDLNREGAGFISETNQVKFIDRDGRIEDIPMMLKTELAELILDKVKVSLDRAR